MFSETDFEKADRENYYGGPLGVEIDGNKTIFRAWSPLATGAYIRIYADGTGSNTIETLPMERHWTGCWQVEILRNLEGFFYVYVFEFEYRYLKSTADIYAVACGVNGDRSAVVDLKKTDPFGWDTVGRPVIESPCDAVIYECHIRDFSIDESSGVKVRYRGKFLGMAEDGLYIGKGTTVGLAHLKELGVTHVQLLPIYDYATVDEAKPWEQQFNWGYDPKNYNCPEGSYSTDAESPSARIFELKTLIMELHKNGIGVIMDVVYNHTYLTENSWFDLTFPGYFYRMREDGYSNGSGVGSEIASERAMVRRYIVDSVKFWANEYKLDGFRFDLMAVLDCDTINEIRSELDKLSPYVMMYGEGWSGGECAIESSRLCYKWNNAAFPQVGLFNDDYRDAIKGATFDAYRRGYVGGNIEFTNIIKRGLAGSVAHPDISGNDEAAWAQQPYQSINYCEAHDNWTMWDKIIISCGDFTDEEKVSADRLSAALVILAQGVPFLHLGEDFLRSKPKKVHGSDLETHEFFEDNSYNSPDFTNSIKWHRKIENTEIFRYYRELVRLRRTSPLFRMRTADEIREKLHFLSTEDIGVILMKLEDESDCFAVAFNPYREAKWVDLPGGMYFVRLSESGKSHEFPMMSNHVSIPPLSAVVFERCEEELSDLREKVSKHTQRFGTRNLM